VRISVARDHARRSGKRVQRLGTIQPTLVGGSRRCGRSGSKCAPNTKQSLYKIEHHSRWTYRSRAIYFCLTSVPGTVDVLSVRPGMSDWKANDTNRKIRPALYAMLLSA